MSYVEPMLHPWTWLALLVCSAGLAFSVGCSENSPEDGTRNEPIHFDAWPDTLSATGLVTGSDALTPDGFRAAPNLAEYAPRHELWINGSEKVRHLVLPMGSNLDTSTPEDWSVPEGTIAFKTLFFAEHDDGSGRRPVETRALRYGPEGLQYAVYLWNAEGTEAELATGEDPVPVEVTNLDGQALVHQVPSHFECKQCHESSPRHYLGLTAWQLAGRTDAFAERGWLDGDDGAEPDEVGMSPVERDVLGFFYGNCTHCHNDWSGPNSTYSLLPDVAFDNVIDQPTDSAASAPGLRVAPGAPDESVLFLALAVNDPTFESPLDGVRAMPPLGVQALDQIALDLVRDWILALPDGEPQENTADGD